MNATLQMLTLKMVKYEQMTLKRQWNIDWL